MAPNDRPSLNLRASGYKKDYPEFQSIWLKQSATYVPIHNISLSGSSFHPIMLNLEQQPQDICVAIDGSDRELSFYLTNTVVVPKATIIQAFATVKAKP